MVTSLNLAISRVGTSTTFFGVRLHSGDRTSVAWSRSGRELITEGRKKEASKRRTQP